MKSKYFAILAAAAVLAVISVVSLSSTANANPKDVPQDLRLAYKFNVIGYPEGRLYEGGCGGGDRIFVNRDAHHAHILVTDGANWDVTDCDATGDNWAELTSSQAETYYVFVRILGKPGGTFDVCANTFEDHELGETECLLGTINLVRGSGQSKFSLQPSSLFDASNYQIVWDTETNEDFRIAQFRVYKER